MNQPTSRREEIKQIAAELCAFDGLCMDNEPERRKLATWIAQNFTRKAPEP
jgi:hypothetical protein